VIITDEMNWTARAQVATIIILEYTDKNNGGMIQWLYYLRLGQKFEYETSEIKWFLQWIYLIYLIYICGATDKNTIYKI